LKSAEKSEHSLIKRRPETFQKQCQIEMAIAVDKTCIAWRGFHPPSLYPLLLDDPTMIHVGSMCFNLQDDNHLQSRKLNLSARLQGEPQTVKPLRAKTWYGHGIPL
jgi:hypothetical protein